MQFSQTPHVLLYCTDLPATVNAIDGVVCINSGKFVRNQKVFPITKITIVDEDLAIEDRIRVDDI